MKRKLSDSSPLPMWNMPHNQLSITIGTDHGSQLERGQFVERRSTAATAATTASNGVQFAVSTNTTRNGKSRWYTVYFYLWYIIHIGLLIFYVVLRQRNILSLCCQPRLSAWIATGGVSLLCAFTTAGLQAKLAECRPNWIPDARACIATLIGLFLTTLIAGDIASERAELCSYVPCPAARKVSTAQ